MIYVCDQSGTSVANEHEVKIIYWKLPNIQESEIELRRRIHCFNKSLINGEIIPVFKTMKTAHFIHRKDRVSSCLASNIVYKFACEHCDKCYIGETTRHLQTRIREHLSGRPIPSEITLHNHVNFEQSFSVIARTNKTRIAESVFIAAYDTDILLNNNTSSFPLFLKL